jgi:hypothetical protein
MPDVVEAHQARDGTTASYGIAAPAALALAEQVLRRDGADAVEVHASDGYLLASYGLDASSYGTYVGVWIRPAGASRSEVTVVTKRAYALGAITRLTEGGFHEDFRSALPGAAASPEAQRL